MLIKKEAHLSIHMRLSHAVFDIYKVAATQLQPSWPLSSLTGGTERRDQGLFSGGCRGKRKGELLNFSQCSHVSQLDRG